MRYFGQVIALCVVVASLMSMVALIAVQLIDTGDATVTNRVVIRQVTTHTCDVLKRKIIEAQKPPAKDSATAYLIGLILKRATSAERAELARRQAVERKDPPLKPPDCAEEARKAEREAEREASQ